MVKPHDIAIHTPYYADEGDGTVVHRYMDEKFVPRFMDDANNGRLGGIASQQWRNEDRFGRFSADHPTLRLPLHQAFHIACCELSCDLPGRPPVDPARIHSAGMVIRRGAPDRFHRWMLQDDEPQGWRLERDQDTEPDKHLRLVKRGLVKPRAIPPLYNGEQVHPMHTLVVSQTTTGKATRNRTLLYGYLPLGGSYQLPLESIEGDTVDSTATNLSGQLAEQLWPFGCANPDGSPPADCEDDGLLSLDEMAATCCGRQAWEADIGHQVKQGTAEAAFLRLLRTLVERYHLHEDNSANEALSNHLAQINIYGYFNPATVDVDGDDYDLSGVGAIGNLRDYVRDNHEALVDWLAEQDQEVHLDAIGGDPKDARPQPSGENLPRAFGDSRWDLYVTRDQARTLRELLVLRVERLERDLVNSLPVPRFGQGEHDTYFVQPFVRYCDADGRPAIAWGPPSKLFRVTGPLDPEAARPVAIQLPELSDLKRGLARGVNFLTPKSLADKIADIQPDMDFKTGAGGTKFSCLGINLSFSIPIITICAMILLMIVLNLLNFFLRWLPWAFLKLPRLCIPVPRSSE